MTKEEHEATLRRLAEEIERSGGDTPAMLDEIQKLRDEYDEREGMLNRDREERREDDEDWRGKYTELRQKYLERFFTTPDKVVYEQTEDVKRDGETQTFEQLFERREG